MVVLSIFRIASLVAAIESIEILALRGQEGVARLEVVELIDRHHVDRRPSARSWRAGRRPSRRRSCGRRGSGAAASSASAAAGAARVSSSSSGASGASSTGLGLASSPSRSSCSTSAATSSSVACTVSTQEAARCVEVGLGGRARDFELRRLGAHALERRGGRRGSALPARRSRSRSVCDARRRSRTLLAQLVERAQAGVERAPRRRRSPSRSSLAARLRAPQLLAAPGRARASSSRAGVLEPLTSTASALGALDQRRVRRLGFGGAADCACIASRASNSRRCAWFSCSSAARCSASMRAIDCARLLLPRFLRAQLLLGGAALDRRSAPACARRARPRRRRVADLQLEADDGLFLPVLLALQRRRSPTPRRRSRSRAPAISSRSRSTVAR